MIFFVKVRLEQILDSHREMFLNKPSQQNVGKIPTIEFCDDCFTALLTAFGTRNYFFYTYQKTSLSRKVHDFVRMRNALIENTTILLAIESTN